MRNLALITFSLLLSGPATFALAEGAIPSNQEEVRNYFHINPFVGDLRPAVSKNDNDLANAAQNAQLSSPASSKN